MPNDFANILETYISHTEIGATVRDYTFTDEELNESIIYLKAEILDLEKYQDDLTNLYPHLKSSYANNEIDNVMLEDFLEQFMIETTDKFKYVIDTSPSDIMFQMNLYFRPTNVDAGLSGICSVSPNPLTVIIPAAIALSSLGSVAITLSSLSDGLKATIDNLIECEKSKLTNITNMFQALIDENAGCNVVGALTSHFDRLKSEAEIMLSDDSVEALKDSIEGRIASIANQFENLDLTKIQYIQSLFCSIVTDLESVISNPISLLSGFAGRSVTSFRSTYDRTSHRYAATRRAGGVTYIRDGANATKTKWRVKYGNSDIPYGETFDPRSRYFKTVKPSNPSEWSYLKFTDSVINNSRNPKGYHKIELRVLLMLESVGRMLGEELTITSGFRSPEYNVYLRSKGVKAAKSSMHMKGLALDVMMTGFSKIDRKAFVTACLKVGFLGFGYYKNSNFIHVDVGAGARTWGNPYWVWEADEFPGHPPTDGFDHVASSGGDVTSTQANQLALDAGFNAEEARIMAAIAEGESSLISTAHNDVGRDDSYGLWQINMIDSLGPERLVQFGIASKDQLFDPATNAAAAYSVYTKQGFDAWSVYTSGKYKEYLD